MKVRTAILSLFIAVVGILLFAQSPAWAHHKEGHEQGPPGSSEEDADSETTSEDGSTSEEDPEGSSDADGSGTDDDPNSGVSSQEQSATDDGEREATTTTTSSTTPGGQGCDGSHHSDSGSGANQSGPDNPYQNTCDGSPSGNGQGKARPCAGCVGNADDKFPPGQAPNGTDLNQGYECDGNQGIGKTNPAHTGCKSAPPPPPPPPPGPPGPCDANPTMPGIQPCIEGNPPDGPRPPAPPGPPRRDVVLPRPPIRLAPPDVVSNQPPGVLPVTGMSLFGFVMLGLGMIGAGGATLGHKRVRKGARRKI